MGTDSNLGAGNSNAAEPIAINAVKTVHSDETASVSDFVHFLQSNQLLPIGHVKNYPIYHSTDLQQEKKCYLINERTQFTDCHLHAVEFGLLGNYLKITASLNTDANGHRESFLIDLNIINDVLDNHTDQPLSLAELRLLAQLLSGMSLQDAALSDDLSIETKRSQMKSLAAKIKVGRQVDVIRKVLPELSRITDVAQWEKNSNRLFNTYVNQFLPDKVRCHKLCDAQGRSVRVMDYGPQRGKPVIVLHSMIFPDITSNEIEFAYRNNLRLLWPIRPGILESTPLPKSVNVYSNETVEGIELVWQQYCGEPTPIIAMVSSAWHATAFAEKHPAKVSDLTFAATCFSAGKYENSLVYFGSSIAELCSRNTWIMTKTVDFLQSSVSHISTFEKTIKRVFKNCKPDMQILEQEFEAPYHGKRLQMAMVGSPESVKHDYFNQVHFRWSRVAKLVTPVRFIHGAMDSIHKKADVSKMIKSIADIPLILMPDSGHILQYNHLNKLVEQALSTEPKSHNGRQTW